MTGREEGLHAVGRKTALTALVCTDLLAWSSVGYIVQVKYLKTWIIYR